MRLFLLLLLATSANAATYLVRDGGDGSTPTTDWAGAYDQLSSALSAAARGDTIYVADGSYNSVTFNTPVSGTTLITIKKATATDHGTETGWQASYGDGQAEFNPTFKIASGYWHINGVTGGGPENDWAGSTEYGFRIRQPNNSSSKMIQFDADVAGCLFEHIDLSYDFNEGLSYPNSTIATSQDAVYSLKSVSDTTWRYCRFARAGRTAFLTRATWDGITIEYCYFLDNVHGSQLSQHGEIWSANHGLGNLRNITIRYNHFRRFRSTGGLIMSGADEVDIYGNVFELGGGSSGGNGLLGNWSAEPQSVDVRFHHNTIVKVVDARVMQNGNWGTGRVATNNIVVGPTQFGFGGSHDYNASNEDLGEANDQTIASTIFTDYAGGDYTLATDTTAGATLAVLYRTDMLDNTRAGPSRGAFEFNGAPDATPPVISNIASNVQPTSITATWTTDEAATSFITISNVATFTNSTLVTSHSIAATGLTPATQYHFKVGGSDAAGNFSESAYFIFTTGASDSTDPSITLDEPDEAETVSGAFVLQVTATDNVAMSRVDFYVDGALAGSDTDVVDSTFTFAWNSRAVADGAHTVYARAEDTSGNDAFSLTNAITVSNPTTGGLVAHWKFESGAVTTDSAGTNTLTLVNQAAGVAGGKVGGALLLDGDNDRATAANSPDFDYDGDEITIAAWMVLTNTGTWQQGVVKIASTGSNLSAWHIFTEHISATHCRPYGQIRNTSDQIPVVQSAVDVPYGEWFHLALVYDGAGMTLYVNGQGGDPIAQSGNLKRYTDALYIGAHGNGTEDLNGHIDEVRLYNRAITGAEIWQLYAPSHRVVRRTGQVLGGRRR